MSSIDINQPFRYVHVVLDSVSDSKTGKVKKKKEMRGPVSMNELCRLFAQNEVSMCACVSL
jgi:hypothetical protein